MCKLAGIHGHKTNHSLRATATSKLYLAGVDEQLVMEVTGHRSLGATSEHQTHSRKCSPTSSTAQRDPVLSQAQPSLPHCRPRALQVEPSSSATEFLPTTLSTAATLVQTPSSVTVFSAKQQSHGLRALSLHHTMFTNCTVNFFVGTAPEEG